MPSALVGLMMTLPLTEAVLVATRPAVKVRVTFFGDDTLDPDPTAPEDVSS